MEEELAHDKYIHDKLINKELTDMPKVYLISEKDEKGEPQSSYFEFLSCLLEFNFGKYKGTQVKIVLENDAPYIYWCLVNVDYFVMTFTDSVILTNKLKNEYKFSKDKLDKFTNVFNEKCNDIFTDLDRMDLISYNRYEQNDDCKPDSFDIDTYDRYGGPCIDGNILSDNFIDDVLDGNPDAYWNIV